MGSRPRASSLRGFALRPGVHAAELPLGSQQMKQPVTGLVLSGGGARGAYAVGVLDALTQILREAGAHPAPFDVFSGTSVGSINAAYLAANAHQPDQGLKQLSAIWSGLDIDALLQTRRKGLELRGLTGSWFSQSLLAAEPLDRLVRDNIPFEQLHANVQAGRVRAVMVAAFNIRRACTTIFSELYSDAEVRSTRDPSRTEQRVQLSAEHILASSAMPFVFPSARVGEDYYCDGGVRFNTPISSAIRAGVDRLVVISLNTLARHDAEPASGYPSVPYLAGRLLNALLLDPVDYDLEVLERFNRLSGALADTLSPADLARVHAVLRETRGAPYRVLQKLVLSPSEDLARLAHEHLREHLSSYKLGAVPRYFLKKAAAKDATWEADWAAYLLFDGAYAARLIDLGRRDTFARRREVLEFFAPAADSVAAQ